VGGLEEGLLPSDSNSDSDSEVAGVWTGRGTGVGAGPDERDDCAGMNAKGGRGVVGGGSVFIGSSDVQFVGNPGIYFPRISKRRMYSSI